MQKKILAFSAIFLVVVVLLISNSASAGDTVEFPTDFGQGFQNDSYLYFDETKTCDSTGTYQEDSSNATYPDFMFYQMYGSSAQYGFWVSGCNITITAYFESSVLEFTADDAGTVKVYIGETLEEPSSVVGASGVFDAVNDIATLTITAAGTVQLLFVTSTPPPGGGGGATTSEEPTVSSTPYVYPSNEYSDNAFSIEGLDLGTIRGNSTAYGTLRFRFSGSSIRLTGISFSEPFESWLVKSNFPSQTFLLTAGESSGEVVFSFQIPGDVEVTSFEGTVTVTALDAFGVTHSSSANVYALTEGATLSFSVWLRRNPIFLIPIVGVILGGLCVLVVFTRRR